MHETHDDGATIILLALASIGMGGYVVAITHWNFWTTGRRDDDPAGGSRTCLHRDCRTDEHQIKKSWSELMTHIVFCSLIYEQSVRKTPAQYVNCAFQLEL
jgi:hypothetical protein